MLDGHEDILDQPLDYDTILPGSYCGLLVRDRWSGISPGPALVTDPRDAEFGLPDAYQVANADGSVVNVHHSRVLRFIGRDVPEWEKQAEMLWGVSEIEHVFDELKKRDNTSWNIANLVFRANLLTKQTDQLDELLALGDVDVQRDVYQAMQAQNWLMNNFGVYLMGKGETLDSKSYAFSGIAQIMEVFMYDIAGAAEMPFTKLFGRSPAGLNATGESDMQTYYDSIGQKQETYLSPALDKLLPVIALSEWGYVPEDFDYSYNQIGTLSNKDKAELADKGSEAIGKAFDRGLISARTALKELRQQSDITGYFTNVTDEDIERASDEPERIDEAAPQLPFGDTGDADFAFRHSPLPADDEQWNEAKHPRRKDGKFGSGGGEKVDKQTVKSGSEAEKDCKFKNKSPAVQAIYDRARENERKITPDMEAIAKKLGTEMYGLEFSVKTASSLERKIDKKMLERTFTEEEVMENMGDIVRYTQMCKHDKIAENALKTVELLRQKGYDISEIDNKYLKTSTPYKGVHINALSPDGQKFELQMHSKESMAVKESIHPIYEEARKTTISPQLRKELEKQMQMISSKLPKPKGIESVQNYRKRK